MRTFITEKDVLTFALLPTKASLKLTNLFLLGDDYLNKGSHKLEEDDPITECISHLKGQNKDFTTTAVIEMFCNISKLKSMEESCVVTESKLVHEIVFWAMLASLGLDALYVEGYYIQAKEKLNDYEVQFFKEKPGNAIYVRQIKRLRHGNSGNMIHYSFIKHECDNTFYELEFSTNRELANFLPKFVLSGTDLEPAQNIFRNKLLAFLFSYFIDLSKPQLKF